MPKHPTIVVAGYGTWALAEANPAELIVEELQRRDWPRCHLVTLKIPVATNELYDRIEKALLDHKPEAWIGLGVAPNSAFIRAEMVGVNWRHFSVPDASGVTTDLLSVIEGGPDAYNAKFPNKSVVEAIKAAKIPAVLSFSAGTHLCNQMLYTTRHLIEMHDLDALCGFLHVPQTPEHVAKQGPTETSAASMSVTMMTEAVVVSIDHVTSRLTASRAGT